MATKKASTKKKSFAKKTDSKPKTATIKTAVKQAEKVIATTSKKTNLVKKFFACKHDANENILTIFKSPKIYAALIGEVIGTMLLAMLLLTLGYNPLYVVFGVLVITVGVFAFSGAHLNPAITVGMMATRRVSAIRGTLYIIAQIFGAWLGFLIISAFNGAGAGITGAKPISITATDESVFWVITMLEFLSAAILGFFFARALVYKRSVFTFGAIIAGGVFFISLIALIVTGDYLGLQNVIALNPAIAIVYQVLPAEGANFGELLGGIATALTTFAVFPMLGAVIGFFANDATTMLNGEETKA